MAEVTCVNGHTSKVALPSSRFCGVCGGPLLTNCPNGHALKPNVAFCRICGAKAEIADDANAEGPPSPAPVVTPSFPTSPQAAAKVDEAPTQKVATSTSPISIANSRSGGVAARDLARGSATGGFSAASPTPPPIIYSRRRRSPLVWIALVVIVILLGAGGAVFALRSSHHHASASPPHQKHASAHKQHRNSSKTQPSITITKTPPTQPLAEAQASALSALLSQSANDRSAIVAAVNAIANCGDLQTAETTLTSSASNRESLLSQLNSLTLSALPNSVALTEYLIVAWDNSLASDQSYAGWANDEISNGCTDNDTSDVNYQNAQVSDAQSTKSKTSFTALWNPIANTYNLPTVTPTSI
jgi:hypothetical protein